MKRMKEINEEKEGIKKRRNNYWAVRSLRVLCWFTMENTESMENFVVTFPCSVSPPARSGYNKGQREMAQKVEPLRTTIYTERIHHRDHRVHGDDNLGFQSPHLHKFCEDKALSTRRDNWKRRPGFESLCL